MAKSAEGAERGAGSRELSSVSHSLSQPDWCGDTGIESGEEVEGIGDDGGGDSARTEEGLLTDGVRLTKSVAWGGAAS